CVKPHFAVIVAGAEAWLWLFRRDRCRTVPFVAFVASGAIQVALFFLLFDFSAYFQMISVNYYYEMVGMHYPEVVQALLRVNVSIASAVVCLLALGLVASTSRLRVFVEAIAFTVLFADILIVLQGYYRPYYLITLYIPAGALLLMICVYG